MELACEAGASDVHIRAGLPPKCRTSGSLTALVSEVVTAEDCRQMAEYVAGDRMEELDREGELDLAYTFRNGRRTRINFYYQQGTISAAIRILSNVIPALEQLGLPPAVRQFSSLPRGMVIVTGETGSGKSTTLAAILDEINHSRHEHIITLEDPIEYVYQPDGCQIDQREIGRDTKSYAAGLRAALRQDPDVILIGEMRDQETIQTALTAAETGHLVFATLHTMSAADAVDRIVDVFSEEKQRQVRMQLSMTLQAVLSQQLLPKADGTGRVAACEVMMVNPAIRNLIREGKTPQIANVLATSAAEGSISMDNSLLRLVRQRVITQKTAEGAAADPDFFRRSSKF